MRTADAELFQDKIEVSLDGRQIFYLFFGGAVVACLVFVLGVMVGRRLEARSHVSAPVADTLRDPLAALDQLNAREAAGDLSFPAALTGDGPVDDPLLEAAVAADATAESAAGEAPPRRPAPANASAEPAKGSAQTQEAPKPRDDEADKAAPAEAAAEAPSSDAAAVAAPAASKATKPRFTLQMSAFRDPDEAESFRAQLAAAGYKAYIVEATVPDKGTWFRVRLGKFASYDDAIAAKQKFEADQHIIAYVTRL